MFSRVLFIDSDAAALARITRSIERTGRYEADAFVTGQAALEHAEAHPPDLAVIALNVGDMPPAALALRLREIRPGLPIVLRAPTEPDAEIIRLLNPQGIVRGAYTTREMLPLFESALAGEMALPTSPFAEPEQPVPAGGSEDAAALDEILAPLEQPPIPAEHNDFERLVESMRTPEEKVPLPRRREMLAGWTADQPAEEAATPRPEPLPAEDSFFRLAAEEPSLPGLEDTGTVSDLIAVTGAETHRDEAGVINIPEEMIAAVPPLPLPGTEKIAAGPEPAPAPLPHLPAARTRPVGDEAEPAGADAHAAALALELTQSTLGSAVQASVLIRQGEVIAVAGQMPAGDVRRLAEMIDWQAVLAEGTTKIKFATLPESHLNYMVVAAPTIDDLVLLTVFPEHMHLRTIRQQTRAIVDALTRTSGPPEPEAPAPAAPIAEPPPAAPATPEIEAAASVPSPEPAAAPRPARAPAGARKEQAVAKQESYACAWILRDPTLELDPAAINALAASLDNILSDHAWPAGQVDIQPDYVSAVLTVPAEETPSHVIQTLMRETARQVTALRPDLGPAETLWADAYYVVAPGRALTAQEVARFISYQRQV